MRTLQLHFPNDALSTLDTVLKQTKEARVFRRAQAVREVVKGTRLQTVSATLAFTYSALSKWLHRFAHEGARGLVDRPRSGRPPKVTCALERHLHRLVEQDLYNMALSILSGVVANSPRCWPTRPVSSWAVKASAVS
jgi:transposase